MNEINEYVSNIVNNVSDLKELFNYVINQREVEENCKI